MENREDLQGMVPPSSMEAEVSVLGAMLQDSTAVLRASEQLKTDDFYHPEHREIFRTMAELNEQHSPVDLVTMQAELARRGTLDGVGGINYLLKIIADVPTAANVQSYIDIVLEKSVLRKLIDASRQMARMPLVSTSPEYR